MVTIKDIYLIIILCLVIPFYYSCILHLLCKLNKFKKYKLQITTIDHIAFISGTFLLAVFIIIMY